MVDTQYHTTLWYLSTFRTISQRQESFQAIASFLPNVIKLRNFIIVVFSGNYAIISREN